jgi:hypothetical protein
VETRCGGWREAHGYQSAFRTDSHPLALEGSRRSDEGGLPDAIAVLKLAGAAVRAEAQPAGVVARTCPAAKAPNPPDRPVSTRQRRHGEPPCTGLSDPRASDRWRLADHPPGRVPGQQPVRAEGWTWTGRGPVDLRRRGRQRTRVRRCSSCARSYLTGTCEARSPPLRDLTGCVSLSTAFDNAWNSG